MSSSMTANSPSPHFQFPTSSPGTSPHANDSDNGKDKHEHGTDAGNDYFNFNSTSYRVLPKEFPTESAQSHDHQVPQQTDYQHQRDRAPFCFPPIAKSGQFSTRRTNTRFDSAGSNSSETTLVDPGSRPVSKLPMADSSETLFEHDQSSFLARPPRLNTSFSSSYSPPASLNRTPTSATENSFFARNPSSPTPTRPLVRHATSLSQDFSRYTRINKDMVHPLPQDSCFISPTELANFLSLQTLDQMTGVSNLIVVDVRPFGEFSKSHIRDSVNMCLSSTLLKRATFDLKRCLDSLPQCDKLSFSCHLESAAVSMASEQRSERDGIPCGPHGLPAVVLYDSCSELETTLSSSLAFTALKFIQDKNWDSPIYLLRGGMQEFNKKYSSMVTSYDSPSQSSFSHHEHTNSNIFSASSPASSPASSIMSISSFPTTTSIPTQPPSWKTTKNKSNSPILARFVLPSPSNPVFKTRHEEEVLSSKPDSLLRLKESEHMSSLEQSHLPLWMAQTIGCDNGSTLIAEKFHRLESKERDRLKKCFSRDSNASGNGEEDDDCPEISSGIELGNKNRYKDILPYEHSRVKLSRSGCDYINASYISSKTSSNKYIATQGPLYDTIGDFWSLVVSHRSPLILSLTAQNEGGVEKCAPFWQPGVYHDAESLIRVENVGQTEDLGSSTPFTTRRLRITINDSLVHELLQIHVLSWPDYGATVETRDLLALVDLKKKILETCNVKEAPIIVHCSAGCGRTGTFCAIDSTIDHIRRDSCKVGQAVDESIDPILMTVESFRKQRISMVQTITQYLLIYDTVLAFMKQQQHKNDNNDTEPVQMKTDLEPTLLDNFINDLKLR